MIILSHIGITAIASQKEIKFNISYLVVDKQGQEIIFSEKPSRLEDGTWIIKDSEWDDEFRILPTGTIEKMIGKTLSWDNDVYEMSGE